MLAVLVLGVWLDVSNSVPVVPILQLARFAAADRPTAMEARYPGMAPAAQVLSFDFNGAADELIDLLLEQPDAIDVMNNSWGLDLQPASCAQLAAYNVLDAREFDAVLVREPEAAERVQALMRAKYGTRDLLVSLSGLVNSTVPIRLDPVPVGQASSASAAEATQPEPTPSAVRSAYSC